MVKMFGILGLLAGAGVMLLCEAPVMHTMENRRRYAAVYGTLLGLFVAVSAVQILWGE